MSQRLPDLLDTVDFPAAELAALRLDGEVYRVDGGFAAIDMVPGPRLRATALATVLPAKLIAEQRSAAWVWGAAQDPPTLHEVCANTAARTRPPHSTHLVVREVVIERQDIAVIAGLSLTTPLRTAIDLARIVIDWGDTEYRMAAALMRIGKFTAAECAIAMNQRRNLPNKLLAMRRLVAASEFSDSARAHPIDVVDRIDSSHGIENPVEVGRVTHLEHESAERKAIA
jgi:hypothetical protein